jgi:hypothetical protein
MNNNLRGNVDAKLSARSSKVIPTHYTGRTWRVHFLAYMIIGLALFLGTCGTAQTAGWWSTSRNTSLTGAKVEQTGTGSQTGTDSTGVRGSMTIQEVLNTYNLTWKELSQKFNIPANTPLNSPLNTLEKSAPDFSVSKLRTWLAERSAK